MQIWKNKVASLELKETCGGPFYLCRCGLKSKGEGSGCSNLKGWWAVVILGQADQKTSLARSKTNRRPTNTSLLNPNQDLTDTLSGAFVLGENDFRKSFSPKPACLAATKNEIFRKIISCWPMFTPLTRKWFYTLIFASNHFRKKREREREKREPRLERERGRRENRRSTRGAIVRRARRESRRSTSGAIIWQARSSIAPLVDCDCLSRRSSDDRTDLTSPARSHLLLRCAISI